MKAQEERHKVQGKKQGTRKIQNPKNKVQERNPRHKEQDPNRKNQSSRTKLYKTKIAPLSGSNFL
jgi:hypothetical protein